MTHTMWMGSKAFSDPLFSVLLQAADVTDTEFLKIMLYGTHNNNIRMQMLLLLCNRAMRMLWDSERHNLACLCRTYSPNLH